MTSQQPPAPRKPDLVAFADRIMEHWPECDIDAGDLQEIAAECGLLTLVTAAGPCGDECHCVEYHGEFPVECYRLVDLRAVKAPIPLNEAQERAIKEWAADDRLWTTQETVEFNLRTFARTILKEVLIDRLGPIDPPERDRSEPIAASLPPQEDASR